MVVVHLTPLDFDGDKHGISACRFGQMHVCLCNLLPITNAIMYGAVSENFLKTPMLDMPRHGSVVNGASSSAPGNVIARSHYLSEVPSMPFQCA